MLKYFKDKSQRRRGTKNNSNNQTNDDVVGESGSKLPSGISPATTTFTATQQICDELIEEILSSEEHSKSKSNKKQRRLYECDDNTNGNYNDSLFPYDSRLSLTLRAIVRHPTCLSHFVQFLEQRSHEALLLLKFYMDTENYRTAAQTANRRRQRGVKPKTVSECQEHDSPAATSSSLCQNVLEISEKQQNCIEKRPITTVPELRTLCDLELSKPLTDDEKTRICAAVATNKHQQSERNERENDLNSVNENCELAAVSVRDAIAIYQKYLSTAAHPRINLPTSILAEISLLLCQRYGDRNVDNAKSEHDGDDDEGQDDKEVVATIHPVSTQHVSANCFIAAQAHVLNQLETDYLEAFLDSGFYARYCIDLIEHSMIMTDIEMDVVDGHRNYFNERRRTLNRRQSGTSTTADGISASGEPYLNIFDILHSEVALFYFMEFLERCREREYLDFWTAAINYRRSFSDDDDGKTTMQTDAMVIYERFFSLLRQTSDSANEQIDCCPLFASDRLRIHVEELICAVDDDDDNDAVDDDDDCDCEDADNGDGLNCPLTTLAHCFDVPLRCVAAYLERRHLDTFLQSDLFKRYLDDLRCKVQPHYGCVTSAEQAMIIRNAVIQERSTTNHPLSKKVTTNTLLAMDTSRSHHNRLLLGRTMSAQQQSTANAATMAAAARGTTFNIDARQLTQPDLLWRRSTSFCSALNTVGSGAGSSSCSGEKTGLKFGHVNALGRYERDFPTADAATHQTTSTLNSSSRSISSWSIAGMGSISGAHQPLVGGGGAGQRLKNAMRRWMHLREEDQLQEEIAWQVAEMIVRDVTSITLPGDDSRMESLPPTS